MRADHFLAQQLQIIQERGEERDATEGERSMAATVKAFNAMFGHNITEEQGWQFMVLLKMARSKGGKFRADDYSDQTGYSALAGECAARTRVNTVPLSETK